MGHGRLYQMDCQLLRQGWYPLQLLKPRKLRPGGAGKLWRERICNNYKRLTPLGRFAEDEDIAGPIVFLASDASSFITGHNLLVDGGWTSW